MQFKSSVTILQCMIYSMTIAHNTLYYECIDNPEEITSSRNVFHDDTPDESISHDFIVIPLGCNCSPTWWMRTFNLRAFAFPFDWCVVPYRSLYRIIDNDFKDHFKRDNLVASYSAYWSDYLRGFYQRIYNSDVDTGSAVVLDTCFEILFNHDFPNNQSETIDKHYHTQYEKYARRIQRFFDAMQSGKHIYFLRTHDITKNEAIELYNLLKHKFPTTAFTLIAVGSDAQEFSEDWNIPHVINRFLSSADSKVAAIAKFFWQQLIDDLFDGNLK